MKELLIPDIKTVGMFANEVPETVAVLLERKIIDIAQLYGGEDETYIQQLQGLAGRPVIKAFRVEMDKKCRSDHPVRIIAAALVCLVGRRNFPENRGESLSITQARKKLRSAMG